VTIEVVLETGVALVDDADPGCRTGGKDEAPEAALSVELAADVGPEERDDLTPDVLEHAPEGDPSERAEDGTEDDVGPAADAPGKRDGVAAVDAASPASPVPVRAKGGRRPARPG